MRLTALAGYFAFVIFIANNGPSVHAQSLDISNIENASYATIAMDPNASQLPRSVAVVKKANKPVVYTVKDGDTLIKIAKEHKTTWQRLFDKNTKIKDPNLIDVNDKIIIPAPKEKLKHRTVEQVVYRQMQSASAESTRSSSAAVQTASYHQPQGSSSGNSYSYGYCTWYAKNKRPDLPNNLGNADTWVSNAAAQGFATGSTPRVGAVGQQGMHVVYVEKVNSNGTVTISEMNYGGWGTTNTRTVPASTFMYIY